MKKAINNPLLITCTFSHFKYLCKTFRKIALTDIEGMICFPNAKINLGLRIVEKRSDGYHNLETCFYPIGLKDVLEAVPAQKKIDYSLSISGLCADEPQNNIENNLVTKAFRLLQADYPILPSNLFLHKAIPTGAGLGGGSSDAAFTLKLINEINKLGLSDADLEKYSAHLGADCAFFIKNKPIFATGIGTIFNEITVNLKGYYLVLVKPDINVSTSEAYSLICPSRPAFSLKKVLSEPVDTWRNTVVNDFENAVFEQFAQIGAIKECLYKEGAIFASMSGSGSSVFGIFTKPVDLRQSFPDCFYWSETLD